MTLIPQDDSDARAAYSAQRRLLRRISDHIHQAHLAQGAQETIQGLAMVVTTEASVDERLNYVMPRRGTAWLPENHLIDAIAQLRQQQRTPVVWYADGLFPPSFGQTMLRQGLQSQQEWPLMIYQGPPVLPAVLDVEQMRPLPAEQAERAWQEAQQNATLWQVWHNPLQPLGLNASFSVWDVAAWRGERMVMLMRASRHERSLHLMARAIHVSAQDQHDALLSACAQSLLSALYDPAQTSAADLAFVIAPSAAERKLWRELGFIDGGSLIRFRSAASTPKTA
ncbi:MAG: hypothetical protein NZ750_02745 [Anaerolineae bacterium]|nr:hypothetical protein [Anaerolineae bacterium]